MFKFEYKTTTDDSPYTDIGGFEYAPDDPIEPEGEGWEIIGSAANEDSLFWFWRRPVKKKDN